MSEYSDKVEHFVKKYKKDRRVLFFILFSILAILVIAIVLILVLVVFKSKTSNLECASAHEVYKSNDESALGVYKKFSVAVDSATCSTVGKEILVKNGSAVDALIASAFCNSILNAQSAGIGGGSFMVIYLKDKQQAFTINAREKAPSNADTFMFKNKSSVLGGLATGIPGDLYGLWEAHKIGGKLLWRELVQPTIDLCRNGFKVPTALANVFVKAENYLRSDKGLSDMFINKETNQVYKKDDIIKLPKLARTFELIRDANISAFYDGVLTQDIVDEINANGGNVSVEDFRAYRPIVAKPITVDLNEQYKLYTSSLPSSGVIVAFILKLMSGFNSTSSDEKSNVLFLHRLTEAFKHSYAQRALLGDEDTEQIREIMRNLQNESYANAIRAKIDDQRVFNTSHYGPHAFKEDHGTTHLSVYANGDAVSYTASINAYFGAKYAGTKTGIIYNNEMDDFSTPNQANSYGYSPSESNYIKPNKRPMSSMSPIIIVNKLTNQVRLVLGASGGSKIISSVAQVAIKNLWLGINLKEAIDAKRIHHQLLPPYLYFEQGFDLRIIKQLEKLGHEVKCFELGGSVLQGIAKIDNTIYAVSDNRKSGAPDGL